MAQQKGVFDRLRERGEELFTVTSNELMSNPQFIKAIQAALKGKEMLDEAVGRALKSMNVPTRAEYKRTVARLDALEREVASLQAKLAAPAAPARARAASRPRAKKGTPPSGVPV